MQFHGFRKAEISFPGLAGQNMFTQDTERISHFTAEGVDRFHQPVANAPPCICGKTLRIKQEDEKIDAGTVIA